MSTPETKPTGTEAAVCADIARRQAHGLAKYGVTVADNKLSLREWLQHAYEETLDNAVYLKRAMEELDKTPDELITEMAERFCRWPLPAAVCADPVASIPGAAHRSGTNLLSVSEAKEMIAAVVCPSVEALRAKDQETQERELRALIANVRVVIKERDDARRILDYSVARPVFEATCAELTKLRAEHEELLKSTNDALTWQYWRDRARKAEGNAR